MDCLHNVLRRASINDGSDWFYQCQEPKCGAKFSVKPMTITTVREEKSLRKETAGFVSQSHGERSEGASDA
jgi:uncharacterized protein YegJ (DUF2314 family)